VAIERLCQVNVATAGAIGDAPGNLENEAILSVANGIVLPQMKKETNQ
jgi:hypothetical protein